MQTENLEFFLFSSIYVTRKQPDGGMKQIICRCRLLWSYI